MRTFTISLAIFGLLQIALPIAIYGPSKAVSLSAVSSWWGFSFVLIAGIVSGIYSGVVSEQYPIGQPAEVTAVWDNPKVKKTVLVVTWQDQVGIWHVAQLFGEWNCSVGDRIIRLASGELTFYSPAASATGTKSAIGSAAHAD